MAQPAPERAARRRRAAAARSIAVAAVCAGFALGPEPVRAELEDEIQVYTDDINAPGEFGLELHVNNTLDGRSAPDYPGEVTPNHGTRVTPEFSYGLSKTFEAGLYVPSNIMPNGNWAIGGAKLRLKWLPIQPREHGGWFYGENVEWGRLERRFSESRQAVELRTILGYRDESWLVSFNPNLDFDVSPGFQHDNPDFNVGLKVSRRIADGVLLGGEYYADFGGVRNFEAWSGQSHSIFFVADIEKGPLPFQVGLGRGLSPAADDWTIKAIFDVPLR